MATLRFIDTRVGEGDTCTVNLKDPSGKRIPLTISTADLDPMVNALAGIAAIMAAPKRPDVGRVVQGAHLPVMHWQTGRSKVNDETVLILTTSGGITQTFQMPEFTAHRLGLGLIAENRDTPRGKPS